MAEKGGIELAKAYVQIVPSADGIGDKIRSALNDSGIGSAGDSAGQSIGSRLLSGAGSILKTGAKTLAGVAIGAAAGAAAAIGATVKSAIENYAEFEQLQGGAELMFGDGYDYIMEKAQQAYSTVQMSQNDYLEQVNGLAVGLKTALGGNAQAAAELADKVITAEADVVAATGNSQEAVQNAFNGIMKSNYSMMDNLGLGITPTKEGFQEVIDKVNEWHAAQGDLTEYTMDSLADQQAALVDYVEMCGMAGYAQAEASDTIQGTLSGLKAAWENLLTGFADPSQDIAALIDNFVSSLNSFLDLLVPRIQAAIPGIIEAFGQIMPVVIELGGQIMLSILQGLIEQLPTFLGYIPTIIVSLGEAIYNLLSYLVACGVSLLESLGQGIMNAVPELLGKIPGIISDIIGAFGDLFSKAVNIGKNLIEGLWNGISNMVGWIYDKISGFAGSVLDYIKGLFGIHSPSKEMAWIGEMLDEGLAEGIDGGIGSVNDAIDGIVDATTGSLTSTIGVNGNSTITYDDKTTSAVGIYALLQQYLPYLTQHKDIYIDGSKVAKATYPSLKKEVEKNYRIGNLLMGVN